MIPKFLRPETVPYLSVERVDRPRTVCAWCPDFDPTTQAPGLSHGMCQACSDRALFKTMKSIVEPRVAPRDDDEDVRDQWDADMAGTRCGTGCGYCGGCS